MEYAIEAEVKILGGSVFVGHNNALFRPMLRDANQPPGPIPILSDVKFSTYPLGSRDEISTLLVLFYRDFWNVLGKAPEDINLMIKEP